MRFNFWIVKTGLFFTRSLIYHSHKFQFIKSACSFFPHSLLLKRQYMDLSAFIKIFEERVPPYLAESWDNTGLLIDSNRTKISTVLFTNDLTKAVLDEALAVKSHFIMSYHPPIFAPIKSLKNSNWKDHIVMKCIENSIAVYSPHTACDAVADGVNDWLINSLSVADKRPISLSHEHKSKYTHMVDFKVPHGKEIGQLVQDLPDSDVCSTSITSVWQKFRIRVNEASLNRLLILLSGSGDMASASITPLNPLPILSCGMGRIGTLIEPLALGQCIETVKSYLNLDHIRFAKSVSHTLESPISTVAVCAGSGSSVLKGVVADLYITGEMSHHDILDANHRNVSVILCEHSNSERGYLEHLVESLRPKLDGIKLIISLVDKDPVSIM